MKNLAVIIITIIGISITSCTKETENSWETGHSLSLENIIGEEVFSVTDSETRSVNNNIFFPYKENIISGRYQTGSASDQIGDRLVGVSLSLGYTFEDEADEGDFTNEMFKLLWIEGAEYELGNPDNEILESLLYVGVLDDNKELQQYITKTNSSEDNNYVKVISMEYDATNSFGVDTYKVEVTFESRMVNKNDETDVLFLKDGHATFKVTNFSQAGK